MLISQYLLYLVYTVFFLIITFSRYFNGEITTIAMFCLGLFVISLNYKSDVLKLFVSMQGLFLIWILTSLLWTENNYATSRAFFQILSTFVFTISFIILIKKISSLVKYATFFMIVVLTLNIIVLFVPLVDVYTYDARYGEVFHGLFSHKNGLGKAMTLFSLFSLWGLSESKPRKEKWIYFFSFLLSTIFIILSKNSGALGILLFSICILFSYRKIKSPKKVAFITLILSVVPFYLILKTPEWIKYIVVEFFDRDLTFTGRVYIWEVLSYYIEQNLYLGYGYQAFWSLSFLKQTSIISSLGFNPTHAHNGIIDMILGIGIIGFIIYLLILCRLFISLRNRQTNTKYVVLSSSLFLVIIYNNILEVDLIYPMSLFYVIQILIFYYTVIKKT